MAVASFGNVSIEAVGFDPYPSAAIPKLKGYSNQTLIWELPFERNDMLRAWLVFKSFFDMATQANEVQGKAKQVAWVADSLSSMYSWFFQYQQELKEQNASAEEQNGITTVLNDLTKMKSMLGL
ncbi:MAG: hypothetical protein JSS72_00955 [Armatimonadetes bacterium]|nr:hypothetical protein [Armatimonadota bacterium]